MRENSKGSIKINGEGVNLHSKITEMNKRFSSSPLKR